MSFSRTHTGGVADEFVWVHHRRTAVVAVVRTTCVMCVRWRAQRRRKRGEGRGGEAGCVSTRAVHVPSPPRAGGGGVRQGAQARGLPPPPPSGRGRDAKAGCASTRAELPPVTEG